MPISVINPAWVIGNVQNAVSNDTYQGTEIVSEYKQGKSVGFENEFGVTVSQNVSGGTSHKQITVTKCRSCDTLLGEKDYHLTAEELQQRAKQQQAQAVREHQAWAKVTELWQTAKHCLGYFLVVGVGTCSGWLISYLTGLWPIKHANMFFDGTGSEGGFMLVTFVCALVAAGIFVFFKYRGKPIPRQRVLLLILLLLGAWFATAGAISSNT